MTKGPKGAPPILGHVVARRLSLSDRRRARVLSVIKKFPSSTASQIHRRLVRQSWVAKIFGKESFITVIFGPSMSSVYVELYYLGLHGKIRSEMGKAFSERGGHRPRHYWIVKKEEDDG